MNDASAEVPPALRTLAEQYRFKPFRNYRAITSPEQTDVLLKEIHDITARAGGLVFFGGKPPADAAVVAHSLAWDSAFFGVSMAKIDAMLGDDFTAREAALRDCLAKLRAGGARHVSATIDVADIDAAMLLQASGFRLTGGTLTYAARPGKEPPLAARELGHVRPFQSGDADDLLDIGRESFETLQGRFQSDPYLPRDRVAAFYEEWTRRCVTKEMADVVLVAEGQGGRLLGFLAFRRREPVSSIASAPVFGGGLGACRRDAPGAYPGLLAAAVRSAHAMGGVAEAQTQSHNYAAISIYEAVGLHYRRAENNFVHWMD